MLRRRSSKGTTGSSEPGAAWTGHAEVNYVEMSFARVPIFKACSRDELMRVARVTRIREHLDGDVVIHEGAKGRDFFVILEGSVKVTRAPGRYRPPPPPHPSTAKNSQLRNTQTGD